MYFLFRIAMIIIKADLHVMTLSRIQQTYDSHRPTT